MADPVPSLLAVAEATPLPRLNREYFAELERQAWIDARRAFWNENTPRSFAGLDGMQPLEAWTYERICEMYPRREALPHTNRDREDD